MIIKFIKKYYEIIILCILGLTPLLWFHGSEVILGHDSGLVMSPVTHFFDRLYLWTYRFGLGQDQSYALSGFMIHGFEAFVASLNLGLQATQKIVFIFWFLLPGITMYVFGKYVEKKFSFTNIALPSAVFFMFNHFLLQGWFIAERTKFSLYAAMPLLLLFLLQWVDKKRSTVKTSLFISLLFFFLNGNASFPLFGGIFVVLFAFLIFFIPSLFKTKRIGSLVLLIVLTGICSSLLNLYWFLPYYNFVKSTYSQAVAQVGGVAGVLTWVNYISKDSSILNLLRLQGIPEWYQNPDHAFANIFLTNPVLILISFCMPILAFLPLLFLKTFKNTKLILFLLFIAVISVVFVAGSHPPFGAIYVFMVKFIPGFVAFRTPFYKFAPSLWFSYSLLLSISVSFLLNRYVKKEIYKRVLTLFLVCGIVLYSFPFLSGSFFDYVTNKRTMKTEIPSYVLQFKDWIDKNNTNDKIIALPFSNRSFKVDAYTWHYWGLSPITSLLTNAPIVNRTFMSDNELDIFDRLDLLMRRNDPGWKSFARSLDATLFLARSDFVADSEGSSTYPLISYMKAISDPEVTLVKEFGEWSLYRLSNRKDTNKVQLVELNGGSADIGIIASLPTFNQNNIVYQGDIDAETKEALKKYTTERYVVASCVFCSLEYAAFNKDLYRPLITKGSIFYPLADLKDKKQEKLLVGIDKARYNLYKTLENLLAFDRVVIEDKDLDQIPGILDEFDQKMDLFQKELVVLLSSGNNYNDFLLDTENVFRIEEELINENANKISDKVMLGRLAISFSKMRMVKDYVANKIWRTLNETDKRFLFHVNEDGNYLLYLRPNQTLKESSISYEVDHEVFSQDSDTANSQWIELGQALLEKGDHRVQVTLPVLNLFTGTDSATINSTRWGSCYSSDIIKGETGESYKISFDHKRLKGNKKFYFKIGQWDEKPNLIDTTEGDIRSQGQWDTFETTYKSNSPIINNFYFSICNPPDSHETFESSIEINTISIRKISVPQMVLVEKVSGSPTVQLPIKKIDSTSYSFEKHKSGIVLLPFSYSNEWITGGEESKFLANGYANAWLVENESQGNIIYKSQRLVVVGFAISGLSFIAVLMYLIYEKIKK